MLEKESMRLQVIRKMEEMEGVCRTQIHRLKKIWIFWLLELVFFKKSQKNFGYYCNLMRILPINRFQARRSLDIRFYFLISCFLAMPCGNRLKHRNLFAGIDQ